jgi:heme/copper-type cytochrome/quinol oxidase subunit 2
MSFRLADAIFWVAVACCSIAQLAILRSVIISPARVAEPARSTSTARRLAEIAWAVLPGIALGVLFVFTWRAMHDVVPVVANLASLRR